VTKEPSLLGSSEQMTTGASRSSSGEDADAASGDSKLDSNEPHTCPVAPHHPGIVATSLAATSWSRINWHKPELAKIALSPGGEVRLGVLT
jgi:hypothetical protein